MSISTYQPLITYFYLKLELIFYRIRDELALSRTLIRNGRLRG